MGGKAPGCRREANSSITTDLADQDSFAPEPKKGFALPPELAALLGENASP